MEAIKENAELEAREWENVSKLFADVITKQLTEG
jgi:hypothetical protein